MTSISSDEAVDMLIATSYDFSSFQTVVEVGNSIGLPGVQRCLLMTILKLYPEMKGCIFDRPWVVETLRGDLLKANLSWRCLLISGDSQDYVPANADAYLLMQLLHTMQAEQCIQVLTHCRAVMRPGGRILLVEQLPPTTSTRQHTTDELATLFSAAGLHMLHVLPTHSSFSIIEGTLVM